MKIGICADHAGFELKETIKAFLSKQGFQLKDFGAFSENKDDDYPDFVIPLSMAVAKKEVERGVAVCGSGVGACIVANKVKGVRAALITDHFSAHQGVEDDDMNVICLGGRVTGTEAAKEFTTAFLNAKFSGAERHLRRLEKVKQLEENKNQNNGNE